MLGSAQAARVERARGDARGLGDLGDGPCCVAVVERPQLHVGVAMEPTDLFEGSVDVGLESQHRPGATVGLLHHVERAVAVPGEVAFRTVGVGDLQDLAARGVGEVGAQVAGIHRIGQRACVVAVEGPPILEHHPQPVALPVELVAQPLAGRVRPRRRTEVVRGSAGARLVGAERHADMPPAVLVDAGVVRHATDGRRDRKRVAAQLRAVSVGLLQGRGLVDHHADQSTPGILRVLSDDPIRRRAGRSPRACAASAGSSPSSRAAPAR